jgi:serine/threonine-protein kinase RsbW
VRILNSNQDNIELLLPLKPEYVSVARLTASGIANRVGFDIDTIEDIKVAISEVCSKIVSIGSSVTDRYTISFAVLSDKLVVSFACEDKSLYGLFKDSTDELGFSILTALMDDLELFDSTNGILLSMEKSL